MRTPDNFWQNTAWPGWTKIGRATIPLEQHPLSKQSGVQLPENTTHLKVVTYLGDPTNSTVATAPGLTPVWENTRPANEGPNQMSWKEYQELLRQGATAFGTGNIALAAGERTWTDAPEANFHSSTLGTTTHVEQSGKRSPLVRATTVFERRAPRNVQSVAGTEIVTTLEAQGFPSGSFVHLNPEIAQAQAANPLLTVAGSLAEGLKSLFGQGLVSATVDGALDAARQYTGAREGTLKEQLIASRHISPPRR